MIKTGFPISSKNVRAKKRRRIKLIKLK